MKSAKLRSRSIPAARPMALRPDASRRGGVWGSVSA